VRNGRPTYDHAGFQSDYNKVLDWMKPFRRKALTPAQSDRLTQRSDDESKMANVFFEKGARPGGFEAYYQMGAFKERVSKDLGILWHKVGLKQVREWEQKGFTKAQKGQYREFSQQCKAKMSDFRKGLDMRVGRNAKEG
jgi:hypothetical protein